MKEIDLKLSSGWTAVAVVLVTPFILVAMFVTQNPIVCIVAAMLGVVWFVCLFGFIIVNPNEAKVVQLFGKYIGTIKDTGFYYGNPFYWRRTVSLRATTFETGVTDTPETKDATGKVITGGSKHRQPSKVNDRDGTPIDIAAVVVYRVVNAAEALFQVNEYVQFVHIQSDSALRTMATQYSYDAQEDDAHSLRGHTAEVAEKLKHEIQERVRQAGVEIQEARISYLAYAPEIAAAMLQRQQAGALIAARSRIVEGAVGMVEHALEMLAAKNVVHLDEERKAAMVSNLLVVLCGHTAPTPVVNAGSIYQ